MLQFIQKALLASFFYLMVITNSYSKTTWIPISAGDITTIIPYIPSESFDAPSNIQVTASGNTNVLSWSEIEHASKYEVQALNAQGVWVSILVTDELSVVLDSRFDGYLDLRVIACNYNSCLNTGSWASISLQKDADFIENVPSVQTVIVPSENTNSTEIAELPGKIQITNQGAANYSIPFVVPKGKGGFTPQLSINYSSLGSNGVAGLGWSLSGYSSISRCQKTLEDEGNYQEVLFNNTDALCLNGDKLRLVNGANLTSGAEYRLDSNAAIKVVQVNSGTQTHFVVYQPSGEQQVFGNTADSTQYDTETNQPYSWMLSSKTNNFAQVINYQYNNSGNQQRILSSVTYSGNTINFVYEIRPDQSTHYYLGNKTEITKRLLRVDVENHNNTLVRSYRLAYRTSIFSDQSLLQSIELCNDQYGSICGQPTSFDYSDEALAGLTNYDTTLNLNSFTTAQGESGCTTTSMHGFCSIYRMTVSDLNNDGRPELIVSTRDGSLGKVLAFEYNNGAFQLNNSLSLLNVDLESRKYRSSGSTISYRFPWQVVENETTGGRDISLNEKHKYDWNGDGYDQTSPGITTNVGDYSDYYSFDYNDYVEYFFEPYLHFMQDRPFDYNGDGLIDRLVPFVHESETLDTLGDGIGTITTREYLGTRYLIEINRTKNGVYQGEVLFPPPLDPNCPQFNCQPVDPDDDEGLLRELGPGYDFNGDGITDYLVGGGIKTGRNFQNTTDHNFIFTRAYKSSNTPAFAMGADINGDGKDDNVYFKQGSIYWRKSLSNSNAAEQVLASTNWGDTPSKVNTYLWADLDGDNQPEILYYDHHAQKIRIRFDKNTHNKQLDKLTLITHGLGKSYQIEYKRLTDSTVYLSLSDAPGKNWGKGAKVRDITSTMSVVAQLTESTGLSGNGSVLNEQTNYFYKGLKAQAGGRGSLGFAEVSSTTQSNLVTTTKYFLQNYPFIGQVYKTEVKYNNQNTIENTEVTAWWQLPTNNNKSYFVAPKITTTTKYFASASNGVISGSTIQATDTLTTNYSISANGYSLLNSTVKSTYDAFDYVTASTSVTITYNDEDTIYWRIARPSQKVTTYASTGQTNVSQTMAYQYNANGAIEAQIKEPNSTDNKLYLKSYNRYDLAGNLVEQTQCSLHYKDNCNQSAAPDTSDSEYKVFRRKSFSYDANHRYLTAILNPHYIEQEFYAYNKFGLATEIRENQYDNRVGQRQYISYDSLGTPYFSYNNDGASKLVTKALCSNLSTCPSNAIFAVTITSNAEPKQINYFDFTGRKVRESSQLLDSSWSIIDSEFNTRGLKVKQTKPYKVGNSIYSELLSYDELGRKASVVTNASLALTTNFTYYNGLVSQVTSGDYSDEASSNISLDKNRSELYNGRGQLKQTTDPTQNIASYSYNALGLVYQATGVDNAVISQQYDSYGRLTQLNDPDKGVENFHYNALGELAKKVAADSVNKINYRNPLGQVVQTKVVQGSERLIYSFNYNNSPLLHNESTTNAATSYSYDNYHRHYIKTTTLDNNTWSQTTYYDSVGRLFRETDISGNNRGLQYQYTLGTLDRIFELKTGRSYYRATAADAFNNITQYQVGSNIPVSKQYDAGTGYLRSILAGSSNGIQNQAYRYDQLGSLRYRANYNAFGSQTLVESFGYDQLNRLTTVNFNQLSAPSQSVVYNANGSIRTKSDVVSGAQYSYGNRNAQCSVIPGVHAVSAIGNERSYCYDEAGNQTHTYTNGQLSRQVTYSLFAKPLYIKSLNGETWFNYDANEFKYKRIDATDKINQTTYYLNNNEVIINSDGSQEIKRYIQDIAIQTIKANGIEKLNYLFKDHIGSGSIITNESGLIEHTLSFDAFGKRRNPSTWQGYTNPFTLLPNLTSLLSITQRGFTGHQQVDHASIVHMGGRIYDPDLGRFLQADPIVQSPKDAQNFNRYSYVLNNPLSYTDPTGYSCEIVSRGTKETCSGAAIEGNESKGTTGTAGRTNNGNSSKSDVNKANESSNLQNSSNEANGKDKDWVKQLEKLTQEGSAKSLLDMVRTVDKDGAVKGEWGKITRDEEGNITNAEVICNTQCQAASGRYTYEYSLDIIRRKNQNDYGALANKAVAFIGVAFTTSYYAAASAKAYVLSSVLVKAAVFRAATQLSGDAKALEAMLNLTKNIPSHMQSLLRAGKWNQVTKGKLPANKPRFKYDPERGKTVIPIHH